MANRKHSIIDELGSRLREFLDDLERLLNPPQPKRAPVPVPVRTPRPQPDRRLR